MNLLQLFLTISKYEYIIQRDRPLFSRRHATLQLAVSGGLSVRPSLRNIFELRSVFALLLLPNRLRQYCHVSSLVFSLFPPLIFFPISRPFYFPPLHGGGKLNYIQACISINKWSLSLALCTWNKLYRLNETRDWYRLNETRDWFQLLLRSNYFIQNSGSSVCN